MPCKVATGINNACGDIIFPGGADSEFYVGYISDLGTKIPTTQTGVITSLSFLAYAGLVKFEGQKFAHKFDSEGAKGAGGNIYYTHRATLKLIALSVSDDVEAQRLFQAQDAFIINKNSAGIYKIYGPKNGMAGVSANSTTGQAVGDDVSDTIVLEGPEITKPLTFLVTDEATTKAYLDARVR